MPHLYNWNFVEIISRNFANDSKLTKFTKLKTHTVISTLLYFIVLCVGDSKAPPVLYLMYRTVLEWPGAVRPTAKPRPSKYSTARPILQHKASFTRLFRQSYASYAHEMTCCRVEELWGVSSNIQVTFCRRVACLLRTNITESALTPQVQPVGRCRLTYAPAWCRWVTHEYHKSIKARKGSRCTALASVL